ncbi:MAG: hypothetical protein ACLR3C_17570 [Eggerthella lenta]
MYAVSGVALTVSTLCMSRPSGYRGRRMRLPCGVLLGGFGIALVILLWSELYGCLNPFRVALYYSASMIWRRSHLFVQGLPLLWLGAVVLARCRVLACAAGSARCPPASFRACRRSFRSLGRSCCSWPSTRSRTG